MFLILGHQVSKTFFDRLYRIFWRAKNVVVWTGNLTHVAFYVYITENIFVYSIIEKREVYESLSQCVSK